MKILIVEDEKELSIMISNYLRSENYICEIANDLQKAIEKIEIYRYDIVLLDITLPDGNGIELLKCIKDNHIKVGVIILSAKSSIEDKITGLDLGADDYITKPFQLSELNARIKAVLRRHHFDGSNIIEFKEIKIDTASKLIQIKNKQITLTKKEYDLLLYLVINKNRVLTKEAIAEHLWNDNIELADNYDFIYTHLNNIRKKIKSMGGNDYIKTIYGMGYKFGEQ